MRQRVMPVVVLVALLTGGCGVEEYNIVLRNKGVGTIEEASVVYGDFRSIGGIMIPGSGKGHGHPEYPIPEVATVEWRAEDGRMHRREVEVKKLVPKRFRGDIVFEIGDDDQVTVRVVPREKIRY